MRTLLNAIVLLLLSSYALNAQKTKKDLTFQIQFGSGYNEDTVSVLIDEIMILDNVIISTDDHGYTSPSRIISFEDGVIKVIEAEEILSSLSYSGIDKCLRIQIDKNGLVTEEELKLSRGTYFVIDNYRERGEDNSITRRITVSQYKKQPVFQ